MPTRTVKIKTWEDMAKEFGVGKGNEIQCNAGFIEDMEKSLPEDRIIDIETYNEGSRFFFWTTSDGDDWEITEDMIECDIESYAIDRAKEFLEYCRHHPEQRFWQALRNFTKYGFVYVSEQNHSDIEGLYDTFYMEGVNGDI